MMNEFKTLNRVNWADLKPNTTYISVGLDMYCLPCVTKLRFVRHEGERMVIESEGIFILCSREDNLYEYTLSSMRKANKEVKQYIKTNFPWKS